MTELDPQYMIYRETRAVYEASLGDQTKFIDQAVLTLSGGALGLSLTFLRGLPAPLFNGWALIGGGICLIGSILSVLIGLHSSQIAISNYINDLDKEIAQSPSNISKFNERSYVNFGARFTQWINWIASSLLIAGIVLLAIFAYSNESSVYERVPMSNQTSAQIQTPTVPAQRGAVPVSPAVAPPPPTQSQSTNGPKK